MGKSTVAVTTPLQHRPKHQSVTSTKQYSQSVRPHRLIASHFQQSSSQPPPTPISTHQNNERPRPPPHPSRHGLFQTGHTASTSLRAHLCKAQLSSCDETCLLDCQRQRCLWIRLRSKPSPLLPYSPATNLTACGC